MADLDKRISAYESGTVDQSSYFLQANNGASSKVSAEDIGDFVNTSQTYSGLNTTAKSPIGAINEVNTKVGKILTAKLDAGETSITISDASITADSMIFPYFKPEVMYNSLTPSVGSVVLTFDAQEVDVNIKLEVK